MLQPNPPRIIVLFPRSGSQTKLLINLLLNFIVLRTIPILITKQKYNITSVAIIKVTAITTERDGSLDTQPQSFHFYSHPPLSSFILLIQLSINPTFIIFTRPCPRSRPRTTCPRTTPRSTRRISTAGTSSL